MRYGRIFAALFAVVLLTAACSKGTTTQSSTAPDTSSQGSGSGMLPVTTGGGQGTAQEEGSEGTVEAGGEGDTGTTQTGTTGTVTLTAGAGGQMTFAPSKLSVSQGQTLVVKNAGSVPHTFTVTGQSIDVTVPPGGSQRVKIDLAPGTYGFVCKFHQGTGMTGTLTVA